MNEKKGKTLAEILPAQAGDVERVVNWIMGDGDEHEHARIYVGDPTGHQTCWELRKTATRSIVGVGIDVPAVIEGDTTREAIEVAKEAQMLWFEEIGDELDLTDPWLRMDTREGGMVDVLEDVRAMIEEETEEHTLEVLRGMEHRLRQNIAYLLRHRRRGDQE